ncbi:hypothetical protein LEN26_018765 [Aphanomyces euteiches]|nr:hypothetical protein LEN26_018765 [Aphanomyces euteiches]KAH9116370.1 hypothetical protein AeMF1_009670 [Aphanomyces euteiches]KAH9195705.1 hypothetical protein AeNC1_002307 [Aphanomyces euteiches]
MRRLTDQQNATVLAISEAICGPLPKDIAAGVVSDHLHTLRKFSNGTVPEQEESDLFNLTQVDVQEVGVLHSMEVLLHKLPEDKWKELETVFSLLNTGWGTKLVTGAARMVPFHQLTLPEREDALRNLARSRMSRFRSLFLVLKDLITFCVFSKTRTIHGHPNPFWNALNYAGKPEEAERPPRSAFWEPKFEDVKAMAASGQPIEIETDVVIVGSGAGGGVIAAELAKAGHRVLVLEKASYYNPADASFHELQSFMDNFENSSVLATEDASMMLFAGSAWGGGTHINWSASLRPPLAVCEEWATKYNLPYFGTPAFQEAIDAVIARAGISADHIKHNAPNQLLLDGARKLGYPVDAVPQNTNGHEHSCGYCTLGCPYGEKQGTHVTWLKDAAEAGAKFIDDCYVDKITYSDAKEVTGIVGKVLNGSVQLIVKAKTVVSSCGSLNTPALLLRSGLQNPNIGSHLRLHPVVTLHGFFPDREIQSWKGSILTTVCNVARNIHGNGYGARIEITASLMGLIAAFLPWRSNADYHRLMMQYPRMVSMIILARDLDSVSSISIDSTGRPRIHFKLGEKDSISHVEGLIAAAKILLSQGAVEVNSSHFDLPPLQLRTPEELENPIECATTQKWFEQLRKLGVQQNRLGIVNAHQMGSCRMGDSPDTGAVNPDGESWEVKGLYVGDASLFPTASGVNPMLTTFSIAYSVAQFMKANLSDKTNASLKKFPVAKPWLRLSNSTARTAKWLVVFLSFWWRKLIWTLVQSLFSHVKTIK